MEKSIEKVMQNVVNETVNEMINKLETQFENDVAGEINRVIEGTVYKKTNDFIDQIKRDNITRKDPKGLYKKTELLLYAYPKLNESIKDRKETIEELKIYGVRKRSGSITTMGTGSPDLRSEVEKTEEAIEKTEESIQETLFMLNKIENGLNSIRNDQYFKVIEDHYFSGLSFTKIASKYNESEEKIRKQKNRLINTLETRLFISDYVNSLMLQIGLLGVEEYYLK